MERHAVSRLIGAPPGYVGFDQGGLLTEAVTKKPHAVLLLDEIEKAHPDVFNVLLQVMDHGTLTDNNGRKADFRNVIIIMTTNAGAETMNKATIGFTTQRQQGDEMADIKRLFTPEFRNRLDAIVSFRRWTRTSSCAWSTSSCCSWKASSARRRSRSPSPTRCARCWQEGFRPADGRAPDAAPDPGHHPPRAGRRAAVRPPGGRRPPDGRCRCGGRTNRCNSTSRPPASARRTASRAPNRRRSDRRPAPQGARADRPCSSAKSSGSSRCTVWAR